MPLVERAAAVAHVGLVNNAMGGISAYARSVGAFMKMAEEVYSPRGPIAAVEISRLRPPPRIHESNLAAAPDDRQLCLF